MKNIKIRDLLSHFYVGTIYTVYNYVDGQIQLIEDDDVLDMIVVDWMTDNSGAITIWAR